MADTAGGSVGVGRLGGIRRHGRSIRPCAGPAAGRRDHLPSSANFIFATFVSKDAGELASELRERGIIVRYFNKPRINQFLRITIGTDEQNQRLVDTLKNEILCN